VAFFQEHHKDSLGGHWPFTPHPFSFAVKAVHDRT
jgi:hypothetical protein